jgi:hypothetical protein
MPPAALIGVAIGGAVAGGVGSAMSQMAANKGPRPLFPGLQSQGTDILSSVGRTSAKALGGFITNPGALPDVSSSVNPAFQALYNANKQFTQQGAANIRESFGSSGLSNSSAAGIGLSNYYTQSNADFMNILTNYTLQAQEAAANRQLSASEFGLSSFLGPAFTDVGPKGSVVGAGLSSFGASLQQLAMLKALGIFGGSGSGSGGGGP